jgi:DNA sulfur modification protein DndE
MKPPVETVRIGKQGRDQLIKIKRHTGIENWNIICRWAMCVSLKEPTPPPVPRERLEGGVEMTWKVFAGEESDMYTALLLTRARKDGFSHLNDGFGKCLRAHVNRGLSYLSSGTETKSIYDFVKRWAC